MQSLCIANIQILCNLHVCGEKKKFRAGGSPCRIRVRPRYHPITAAHRYCTAPHHSQANWRSSTLAAESKTRGTLVQILGPLFLFLFWLGLESGHAAGDLWIVLQA